MDNSAVILASGGMDSLTAAHVAKDRGYDLYFLHTSYGQQTQSTERECAKQQAKQLGAVDFCEMTMDHLHEIGGSSLTDSGVSVDEADLDSNEVPQSYVPFRNGNLMAMAASYAEVNGCDSIFIGAHSEDFSGYPDCRPQFFDAFQDVVNVGTKGSTKISIQAPFSKWSKTEIVELGVQIGVSYESSWSCYRERETACGTCDACAYRLQAFQNCGVTDPIDYQERPDYTDS